MNEELIMVHHPRGESIGIAYILLSLLLDQKTIVSGLRPIDMLPNDTSKYYHYAGSLTTPPCYESVSWYVMHEGITVTQDQVMTYISKVNVYSKFPSLVKIDCV